MIKKNRWYQRGKKILKTATVLLTAVSLVSMAQLSACAATTWVFWGEQEEISEDGSDNICVTTVYKGQTEQFLEMEEVSGEISWSVEHPEVLDISEDGELIPLKVGNTMVTVVVEADAESEDADTDEDMDTSEQMEESETEEMVYYYYVSVCKKKAYKAVKKARNALGSAYSQAKRMKKGYYDCSSLVWRSYSPYGILFGAEDWAPTAADQGLWCDENGKTIADSSIEVSDGKLLPGDLIYYTKDADNGRYKKIYHVAMFEGYQMNVDEDSGEVSLSATMIEADGKSVVRNTYKTESTGSGRKVALIARPTK